MQRLIQSTWLIQSTSSTIKSIAALNSAPPPPKNINDPESMKEWKKAYQDWYDSKRKAGITIG